MGFFDDRPMPPPPPEPPRPRRPAWDRPEAAIGGVAPWELLLARSEEAALAVGGFRAFPNGFELTLTMLLRSDDPRSRGMAFQRIHERSPDGTVPEEFVRFGVVFADGTSATNLGESYYGPEATPDPPLLMRRGGGGGGRRYDFDYWVWPLPPAGPMTLIAEWPWKGIAETRAEVDTQPILDAAARAIQVFPEDG